MNFKKILIINPYGIGDVLFTTPVISNLRRSYPQATIAYLANARTADFIKMNPDIKQVFDFSLNSSFGFLCVACGIKKRIGFDYRGRGRFLTDKIPLKGYEDKHVIE